MYETGREGEGRKERKCRKEGIKAWRMKVQYREERKREGGEKEGLKKTEGSKGGKRDGGVEARKDGGKKVLI